MKPLMASLTWPFRHLPIPWSLFLLISTVLAIGFGLAFVNLQESQGVLRTWEEESQLHLVERMARETDQIFDHYSQGVQNFSAATANALQLTGIEGAFRFFLAQQTLQKTLRDNPQYAVIAITDGLGRTLADRSSSNLDPLQFDDYFALGRKAGFQGQRYVSPLILMEGFSFPFVVFSEPVTDAGGTHVAVVCVVIQLEALVNQIVSTVPKWHRVFLCDDQGRLIATTAGSENSEPALGQPGDDFTFHPLVQRFMQNGRRWNELVAYDRADLTYLGTFSVTRTLPWMVASEVPERIA
ncbi:MAG: cache domain-containing protein, partial [Acidobacteria bacterium]|nr:cache domain-containing protein [Acidobacteriota bacterium]